MITCDSTPHASVSDAANQAGSFHFSDMKEALSLDRQVTRLREHGITVTDDDEAAKWLSETNYYRISGYWLTLEHDDKIIPGTTLDDIREIYLLDEGLRLWLWKAIEPVEIKARTTFAYHISLALGPIAHEDPDNYTNAKAHKKSMDSYHRERKRALRDGIPCVTHNMSKYGDLPAWAAVEIMSMGTVSRLIGNLSPSAAYPDGRSVRDAIADEFGTTYLSTQKLAAPSHIRPQPLRAPQPDLQPLHDHKGHNAEEGPAFQQPESFPVNHHTHANLRKPMA